jgi:uncharacterized protein (TIRG00374 family)
MALRVGLLVLGVLLLVYLTVRLGVHEILGMLASIQWSFVLVLGLYGTHQFLRGLAFIVCVPEPRRLSFKDALAVRLSGEAVQYLTFSGPVLAEPAKALLLTRRGLTTWEGLATTLTEYLASSLMAAVMAIAGLSYVIAAMPVSGRVRTAAVVVWAGMLAFVVAFAVGIGARIHIIGAVVRTVARLPIIRGRLRDRITGLPGAENLLIATLRDRPARLARLLLIEALGQICLGLELLVLLMAMSLSPSVLIVMFIEGATKFLTGGLFFVPGQVGVAEGTYAVIFAAFGLPAAAGFAVSFIRRLRSIMTAAVGLAAMSWLTDGSRQLVRKDEA